jgi:capsular exopolysaccharide synthesis family protein
MAQDRSEASLKHFRDIVKKHRWPILGFMAFATVATVIVTKTLTPLYESTVKVNVERRGGGFIGSQSSAAPSSFGTDVDQFMTTQLELIQSDPVLRPATEAYRLLDLEKQFAGLKPAEAARLRAAPIKLKRLKVTRVPGTYIIQISYRANDPKLAADVANTIAGSYLTHAFDSRNRSYVQVNGVVDQRLKDLRAQMEQSGEALAKFARELNLIDPEQRINMLTTRLLQLNTDYTNAQSERLKKQATYEQAQSGSLASAEVSSQGETLEHLVERLNTARQQFATVRSVYGENNPEYKKSLSEVNELERQFSALQKNTLERVVVDFHQATAREAMALKIVNDTKREVDALNNRVFQYQQLKSDAENYKKLYDDLQRVTSEQDINRTFQDTSVQIEEPARAAAQPVFPSMPLNTVLAVVLSGLLGIGFALLHDTLDTKLRGPEQAAKLLNVDVIATLPRMRRVNPFQGRALESTKVIGKMPKTARTGMLVHYYESIRALRNAVGLMEFGGSGFHSILLTSASPGEGKSITAANLAFSYGLLGKKVLVIDADLRNPSLHKYYEKPLTAGLAEVLEDKAKWRDSLVKVAREELYLLPTGTMSDSSPDLIAAGLKKLIEEAYAEYDLVIVDAPPLGVAESLQLAALADAVLVVAKAGSTSTKHVASAYTSLARARANVIGLVMNDVSGNDTLSLYGSKEPQRARIG